MKNVFRAAALIAAFSVVGCFDSGSGDKDVDFDRAALLANLADNLILPAYGRLEVEASALREAVGELVESPDSARVAEARKALKDAWLAWQGASAYEVGPAMEAGLRLRVNTFPTNAAKIEANIAAGSWNLESVSNYVAKGLPALDYLLNGRGGSPDSLIAALGDTADGASRGRYLNDVAGEIAAQVAAVRAGWTEGEEPYREEFLSRLGTDIGSSLGLLVNQFAYDYEVLKNPRIGFPVGRMTLGVAMPEKVEAYHGGYSLELALAHLDALEDFFRGRDSSGADGPGFDDYLAAIGTRYQDGQLSQAILDRFAAARAALEDLADPLSEAIQDEKAKVEKAYEELQKMVVLIKTDMPSALGVSITYQDADGD